MGCDNCDKKITDTCNGKENSRCSIYEGEHSSCSDLNCCDKPTVHETLEDISSQLQTLCDATNTDGLGQECFEYDYEDELQVKDVLEKLEEEVCGLKETVAGEEDCPSVLTHDLTCLNLDYKCLVDECNEQPVTLKDLLQVLINQTCSNSTDEPPPS